MGKFCNLDCRTNTDYVFQTTLLEADGAPTDIAGYVFAGGVENGLDNSEDTCLDFTISVVGSTTDGTIEVLIPRTALAELTPGRYKYEVLYTDTEDIRDVLVEGVINLERGIVYDP